MKFMTLALLITTFLNAHAVSSEAITCKALDYWQLNADGSATYTELGLSRRVTKIISADLSKLNLQAAALCRSNPSAYDYTDAGAEEYTRCIVKAGEAPPLSLEHDASNTQDES